MPGEKKIFIAEDDQHFCELYQMALGTEGYEVQCANTGRDALEMIPREVPDLIILDVMMPEIDGYEVCRSLREMPQFALTPIIMLTALSTDDEKIKGYNVGADDYLTKPFPLKILKAKVRSLVERRYAKRPEPANAIPQPVQSVFEQPQPVMAPPQQDAQTPQPVFELPQPVTQPSQPAQPVVEPPQPATQPPINVFEPPQPVAQPPQPAQLVVEPPQPAAQPPMNVFEPPQPVVQPSQPVVVPPQPIVDPPEPEVEQPTVAKDIPEPTVVREIIREQPTVIREEPSELVVKPGTPLPPINPDVNAIEIPFLGAIPQGSNILVTGGLGCGKSRFSRLFIAQGLEQKDRCMFICLDDDPSLVRGELTKSHPALANNEEQDRMCFVDAYSCGGKTTSSERFAIRGTLDLSDLSTLITEAGATIGQTDQLKETGRRVIDSISSLFINFDLPYVQRFLAFMARSGHFAGVASIFIVEEGTLTDQSLNNIKYIMDGVLEFRRDKDRFLARAQALKWAAARPEWSDISRAVTN